MKILVTGNNGYVGTVLTDVLLSNGYSVTGLDVNYFASCNLEPVAQHFEQLVKDVREIDTSDLAGFDAVVHLAGLSNDPLGEFEPHITEQINYWGTLGLAQFARDAGVKRFVYASSQSMYGVSDIDSELDEDDSKKYPVTTYARTKWQAEQELSRMHSNDFLVTCFRPSTVFGSSPRLRCDIVYNNLVACAYTTGKIEILSDGSPWRPVVHVRDVCQAFVAGLEAPADLLGGRSFNVGIPNGNFTVKDLAESAQRVVPGSELIFLNEHTDPRTYRVSFKRILTELRDYYKPEWDLDKGGKELVDYFGNIDFKEEDFRDRKCHRLKQLEYLREEGKLNGDLRWV